jgi:hypothetical protein
MGRLGLNQMLTDLSAWMHDGACDVRTRVYSFIHTCIHIHLYTHVYTYRGRLGLKQILTDLSVLMHNGACDHRCEVKEIKNSDNHMVCMCVYAHASMYL